MPDESHEQALDAASTDEDVFDVTDRKFSSEPSPLGAILEVCRMLTHALDLEEVLPRALQVAEFTLNASASSIILLDEKTGKLKFHIVDGEHTGNLRSIELERGQGIAGWVLEHGEPQLVPDAYRDHRFDPDVDRQTGFRSRSILCVPLQIGAKRTGVVQVLNRSDGEPFTRDDLSLLELVASFIALAIENAREHKLRVEAQRLAVIGQTVAQLGHCIKNALQGLQGGSYLLDKHLSDHDTNARTRAWAMLQRHINFLGDLVMNMLSYAKKRTPVCEMANVNVFCKDVVEMISSHAANQGVAISLDLAREIDLVALDGTGIKRCLYNLAGNAIDACESGKGQVVVSTGSRDDEPGVWVSIQDNGVGMSEENLSRICEEFFSTKGNRGTGLGLAVCKKIVEEHGGSIRFESTLGKGTKVTILLPAQSESAIG